MTNQSYQQAVIEDITYWANRKGEPVMTQHQYANMGTLFIGSPSRILITIGFNFQSSNTMLLINGAQHGPPGPDNYYFAPTEVERYQQFIDRLKELLEKR